MWTANGVASIGSFSKQPVDVKNEKEMNSGVTSLDSRGRSAENRETQWGHLEKSNDSEGIVIKKQISLPFAGTAALQRCAMDVAADSAARK